MAEKMSFESALARLEDIVELLERGELSLEDSMERFEEGVTLAGRCSEMLRGAETRITELVKRAGESFDLENFEEGSTDGDDGESVSGEDA